MTIPLQTLGGVLAGCISLFAYLPYARETVRGVARPNRATWLIWSVVSGLLFASYNAAAGGAARWVPLSDALGPAVIAVLAIRYGKGGWAWLDVACLTLAGLSVIGWVLTGSPMVSLWINLLLLFLGAIPTFRNLYFHPASEPALAWRLFLLSDLLNLLAIEHWAWASAAYPAYIALTAGVINALICRPALKRVINFPSLHCRAPQAAGSLIRSWSSRVLVRSSQDRLESRVSL